MITPTSDKTIPSATCARVLQATRDVRLQADLSTCIIVIRSEKKQGRSKAGMQVRREAMVAEANDSVDTDVSLSSCQIGSESL